jgi:gamma-glutamyltranspeptidase/glutathione hydrolase/leukotriene-C4 hydrolase
MLFMVNVMENMNLTPSSPSDNVVYQHLVETFKYSFAARSYLGDPYCAECDNQSLAIQSRLISESYASFINASISNNRTFPPDHYNSSYFVNDKGTTHISIVDGNGMAVSVTTTVGGYFGSKLITKSGIVLNNQLDGFSAPNITNIYHLKPFKSHFVLPGKRPLSSTCPSIVLKRDGHGKAYPYMVIGGAGGTFIGTATAQAILRVLSYEESITEAIEAPRLHSQLYPDVVSAEDGYPTGITSYLKSLGHTVVTRPLLCELQGIIRDSDGILTAHSDSRKGGNPLAFVY